MGIARTAVTYAAVAALSFSAGAYSMHYYQQHRKDSYKLETGSGMIKIKKRKGIDNTIDDAVEDVRNKAKQAQETADEFVEDIGKKIAPDENRR